MTINKIQLLTVSLLLLNFIGCGSNDKSTAIETNTDNNISLNNDIGIENNETTIKELTLNYPFTSYKLDNYPSKIALSSDGNRLYIMNGVFGVSIVDIQDVNNPVFINTGNIFPLASRAVRDIVSSSDNTMLYVGASDGIYIYDTSTPNQIIRVAQLTNEFVDKLTISKDGKTLYAVGTDFNRVGETLSPSGLTILDVSNINSIRQLGFYKLLDIEDIKLSQDEKLIYLASGEIGGSMDIVDISNPTQPTKLSSLFNNSTEYVSKIILSQDGTRAYVANNTMQEVQGVALGTNYLTVVNIENPNNPQILNSVVRFPQYVNFGMDLSLNEQNIYITEIIKGFTRISITDDNLMTVGSQVVDGNILDFVLSNDKSLAYIITDTENLIIMQLEE